MESIASFMTPPVPTHMSAPATTLAAVRVEIRRELSRYRSTGRLN
jgi:hypothetical protein